MQLQFSQHGHRDWFDVLSIPFSRPPFCDKSLIFFPPMPLSSFLLYIFHVSSSHFFWSLLIFFLALFIFLCCHFFCSQCFFLCLSLLYFYSFSIFILVAYPRLFPHIYLDFPSFTFLFFVSTFTSSVTSHTLTLLTSLFPSPPCPDVFLFLLNCFWQLDTARCHDIMCVYGIGSPAVQRPHLP